MSKTTNHANNSLDVATRAIVRSEVARILAPLASAFGTASTAHVVRRGRRPGSKNKTTKHTRVARGRKTAHATANA